MYLEYLSRYFHLRHSRNNKSIKVSRMYSLYFDTTTCYDLYLLSRLVGTISLLNWLHIVSFMFMTNCVAIYVDDHTHKPNYVYVAKVFKKLRSFSNEL